MKTSQFRFTFFIILLLGFSGVVVAQSRLDKGITFFEKGDYQNTINTLKKDSNNISSLYYLGLSFEKIGNQKAASKAFHRSVNKCADLVVNQIVKNYKKLKRKETRQRILDKYEANIRNGLLSGVKYAELNRKKSKKTLWKNKIIIIKLLSKNVREEERLFSSQRISRQIQILRKPPPGYTSRARQNGTAGRIRVRVGFLRNGKIGFIIPLSYLADGLTDRAIAAAKRIRFKPAKRNGTPVSMVKTVVYSFSIL